MLPEYYDQVFPDCEVQKPRIFCADCVTSLPEGNCLVCMAKCSLHSMSVQSASLNWAEAKRVL